MGDLNYRIPLSESQVKQHLAQSQLDILLACDQLKTEQRVNRTFFNFEEGEIKFNPTYKFDIGTDVYDTR
jgi:phosphatidylinositol-bisphosphatase